MIEEKIELSVKETKQEVRNKKLIGQIIPYNGHQIFKVNIDTLEISEPKYIEKVWYYGRNNVPEVDVEDGFFYVSALNKKNALKHYINGVNGSKKISKNPIKL